MATLLDSLERIDLPHQPCTTNTASQQQGKRPGQGYWETMKVSYRDGELAAVRCLPCKYEDQNLITRTQVIKNIAAHTCTPSVETGGFLGALVSQLSLFDKFQVRETLSQKKKNEYLLLPSPPHGLNELPQNTS